VSKKKPPRAVKIKRKAQPAHVELDVRLTIAQAAELHCTLLARLAQGDAIVVDGTRVEEIDTAGFLEIGEELAHFLPPNRCQIIGIVPTEFMIGLQTPVKAIGVGLSQSKPLGLIGLRLFLNLEALLVGVAEDFNSPL